jgi:cyclic-di-AMP phosphodiesterase PgpH
MPDPGTVLLHLFFLTFFWLLLGFHRRETFAELRELGFFSALFTVTLLLGAALGLLLPGWTALVPIPMASLMIALLYDGRLAMVASVVLSLVTATTRHALLLGPVTVGLAGGVAVALSMRRVRRRTHQYRAVLAIAGGNLLGVLVLGLALRAPPAEVGRQAAMGVAVAVGEVAIAMLLLPLAERISGRTTDFRLLELADPTHPLLSRLAAEAPGTWAHSLVVATLSEAAANAVGANGLLARVGGYYHDVGKLGAPAMFVENQAGVRNPHDALTPEESARIVRDHVPGGVALAEAAGLPREVRNFIPEHHGTMTLDYFVARVDPGRRAAAAGDAAFRYPGPRPQSRETAVVMLADAAEAAVRVLDDPTTERVGEVIRHLIQQRAATGQLAEAPLTLAELERITNTLVPLLAGLHHPRLEYPTGSGGITREFGRGST